VNSRQKFVAGLVLLGMLAAVFVLWVANQRADVERSTPAWLDAGQPPDGVAVNMGSLTDAESWAANRASHMSACCPGRGAGSRVRRTYHDTLADNPNSFIRTSFELSGGC
jgi:hypothetical protein